MIIMTRGLPASGKTHWALEQVRQGQGNVKRVNKDEIRAMIDAGKHSREREQEVLAIRDTLIERWLSQNKTVIVDDTNFNDMHKDRLTELATLFNTTVQVVDFTHVPLGICLERNRNREKKVPESVIFQMWDKHVKPQQDEAAQPWPAIICDLDGTLANLNGRNPYDASTCENDLCNPLVKELWNSFDRNAHMKILVSGRSNKHRIETERWLTKEWIHYHALFMQHEGDSRSDEIIKREIYDIHVRGMYHVKAVIDDRPRIIRMWRYELGLPVIDVGYGIEF